MAVKLIIAGSRTVDPTDEQIDLEVMKLPIWGGIGSEPTGALSPETRDLMKRMIPEAISHVVSGESPGGGADKSGKRWARSRGIEVISEPITDEDVRRWGKYLAPKMRNRRVAEVGDLGLVFWDGKSDGSPDLVTRLVLSNLGMELVLRRDHHVRTTKAAVNTRHKRYRNSSAATESVLVFAKN